MAGSPRDPRHVAEHFDALYRALAGSPAYRALGTAVFGEGWAGQLGLADAPTLYQLAEAASLRRGGLVLDLAAGNAGVAGWFADHLEVRVVALDVATAALVPSRSGVDPVQATLAWLPVRDAAMDAVICLDGFGGELALVLREARRVVRAGGGVALLLNVPATPAFSEAAILEDLATAALTAGRVEDMTAAGTRLLHRWLQAAYRAEHALLAEAGPWGRHLIAENEGWFRGLATGQLRRLLISGIR